jgi:hypothetical protein
VTASEFAFLALGLVLGVASGAALSMVIRARPPAPREIRVTVEPDAVPRRPAATLSGLAAPGIATAPAARGGPADPAILRSDEEIRTPVRSGPPAREPTPIPIRPEADPAIEALRDAVAEPVSPRRAVR